MSPDPRKPKFWAKLTFLAQLFVLYFFRLLREVHFLECKSLGIFPDFLFFLFIIFFAKMTVKSLKRAQESIGQGIDIETADRETKMQCAFGTRFLESRRLINAFIEVAPLVKDVCYMIEDYVMYIPKAPVPSELHYCHGSGGSWVLGAKKLYTNFCWCCGYASSDRQTVFFWARRCAFLMCTFCYYRQLAGHELKTMWER